MSKRKVREQRAVERVEAMFARFRAAEHDPAALEALMEDSLAELDSRLADDRKKLEYLTQHALAHLKAPREQRKRQAAFFRRVRDGVAAEFKRRGMRNPVAQAEEEVAKRYGFGSGTAFSRWLRRNRDPDKSMFG
jgi:hypothetical protein